MQVFKKYSSKTCLIIMLFFVTIFITSCDTTKDDIEISPITPIEEPKDNVIIVSTSSNMAAYLVDFSYLLDVPVGSEVELITAPKYGRADVFQNDIVLYRIFDKNNPRTDEFEFRLNGEKRILRIEYHPDADICEAVGDYYYTTENTLLYDLDIFSNDNLCGTITEWYTERISIEPFRKWSTIDIHGDVSNSKVDYYTPSDFMGLEIRQVYIKTSNGNSYTSCLLFEVGENTDTSCTSSLNDDLFDHTTLPLFEGYKANLALLKPTYDTLGTLYSPLEASHFYRDTLSSLSTFNEFIEFQDYYYIPYLDNDDMCTYLINDWDVIVDWNGIEGGTHGLGFAPFYNSVFFVPTDTPKPFSFTYTLRNTITGEEHTAQVIVN
ncbi:hypothetical protein ACE193_09885 [Bernardetia sp. OM2101]|uniref:hypothetical protein n=1 Tax=Bernardetia sp. OM2101 TaxID=3344876 RepID=UPI0035CFB877